MTATLMYHSIDDSGSPISVSAASFEKHLRWLSDGSVRTAPLETLATRRDAAGDTVAVTFDDGFANTKHALEQLIDHGITPTGFVVTGQVGLTNAWRGQAQRGIPTLPLLGWQDLEELLKRGVRIEAHTRSHPRLTRVTEAEAADELAGSREDLRARLGVHSAHIAYPYGNVNAAVARQAAGSFSAGHTTRFHVLTATDDAMRLPRLDMYYFRAAGSLDTWGRPSFARRLAWIRAKRRIRERLMDGVEEKE